MAGQVSLILFIFKGLTISLVIALKYNGISPEMGMKLILEVDDFYDFGNLLFRCEFSRIFFVAAKLIRDNDVYTVVFFQPFGY